MTLEQLNEYRNLNKLIQVEHERIQTMRDALGPRSSQLSGMPKASGAHDKIGDAMPTIVDRDAELALKIQMLEEKKREIENWIETQPVKIWLICQLRFIQGLDWNEVADYMDDGKGRVTADAVRITLSNHLKRQNKQR